MAKVKVGLQLYSVREDCAKDLPGVLKAVAQMGYKGVEFAGCHGFTAEQLRQILNENGLACCGTHTQLPTLLGDELAKTVAFHKVLGNKYLIVPGLAEEHRKTREAWKKTAGIFNDIAATLKPEKMLTGYHNHHIEFTPLDGEMPWDTFFGNTQREVVMQFDTGNALHGGAHAGVYLRKYHGRAKTVHLKEFSATNPQALIGEGDVHWDEVFQLCETIGGTEWYIVEQESYAFPPMECVARCLESLRKMGKA